MGDEDRKTVVDSERLLERTAQLLAHRACCGTEHDPANGKLHGYCVVCGIPWPCDYAGDPSAWRALVERAVSVLQRHIIPDGGLSDHDALSELYGIFDGPEYRAANNHARK